LRSGYTAQGNRITNQELMMRTNTLQKNSPPSRLGAPESVVSIDSEWKRIPPQRAGEPQRDEANAFQMYKEEEVAAMLQVSLSQLRKWRMRENQDKQHGPPFKKVGRLVRYPARALQAYIDES
jgi:Helix-turn-helix domain